MSEETKITVSSDTYISMIQSERDGNVRVCWKASKPSTTLEMSEIPADIRAHGLAFYGGVAKLILDSLGKTADAIKIAEEVMSASEERVAALKAKESAEV